MKTTKQKKSIAPSRPLGFSKCAESAGKSIAGTRTTRVAVEDSAFLEEASPTPEAIGDAEMYDETWEPDWFPPENERCMHHASILHTRRLCCDACVYGCGSA